MENDLNSGTAAEPADVEGRGGRLHERRTAVVVALAVLAAFALGYLMGRGGAPAAVRERAGSAEAEPLFWTCAMHPQVRQPGPGKCPICSMDLVPVHEETGEALGSRELRLSETARMLAEVRTSPVERRFVEAEVRMVGKVEYDETRLAHITAWVPGRLDRLYVDYTGIPVKQGDHMAWLYSPEVLAAQEELLQAAKAARELGAGSIESVRTATQATVAAAREKLRLWGLTQKQVEEIERRGTPADHVTIYAPSGGIVVEKQAVEGMYVQTGMRIYTIADLSQVWVKLDAYESDLPWVRYGQTVEFEPEAYPGEAFQGRIAFVAPVLDEKTRTVKVRVNVPNHDGRLKPGMFVRAVVRAKVAEGGGAVDVDLAGRWMCPMHPEVVKDSPGACDVCGMPLVRAETLGYVPEDVAAAPLVIPATAPLVTGERAVVYVAVAGKEGAFEGREVVLGPRARHWYVVKSGLMEGERVVTDGAFKIDSSLQILAKPSMMSPEGGPEPARHHEGDAGAAPSPAATERHEAPAGLLMQLDAVFAAYLDALKALGRDEMESARKAGGAVQAALEAVDMGLLDGPAHAAWMVEERSLAKSADDLARAGDLARAREAFGALSETLIAVARRFGAPGGRPLFRYHCPMAFGNRGADWLTLTREVENPFFGAAMPRCGEVVETIPAAWRQSGRREGPGETARGQGDGR